MSKINKTARIGLVFSLRECLQDLLENGWVCLAHVVLEVCSTASRFGASQLFTDVRDQYLVTNRIQIIQLY